MLQRLSIKDFILIDDVELDFCNNLNIFTGETGSGKSILLNALGLLMGERLSGDLVKHGCEMAFINGEFLANEKANQWLIDNGFALEDDIILIKRSIDKNAKNRAHINGMPATGQQLKALSKNLIEIQSQHAQQDLLQSSEQRYIVDNYANHLDLVDDVSNFYIIYQQKIQELQEAHNKFEQEKEQAEYLNWVMQDIEKLSPKENEWQDIQNEHKKLQYASDIIASIESMQECLDGDDGIIKRIRFLQQKRNEISKFDDSLSVLDEFIDGLSINANEMQVYLDKYVQRIDVDPSRLSFLDERIHSWITLSRRLKVPNEELFNQKESLKEQLNCISEDFLDKLTKEVEVAKNVYIQHAQKLSEQRKKFAKSLEIEVTNTINDLAMKEAIFSIEVLEQDISEFGIDKIIFNLVSHKNALAKPIAKIASGGELSRISLAITLASQKNSTISLVFDEIDSGISGITGQKIGQLLSIISQKQQVLCITHLAQVAAFADNHITVSKISDEYSTKANIYTLNNQQRLDEIARLIGGDIITSETLTHAKNLVDKSKV